MNPKSELLAFLKAIIHNNAEEKSLNWLDEKAQKIQDSKSKNAFYLAFSQASRFFSKDNLQLDSEAKQKADTLIAGFQPEFWNVLQTARTYLLLHFSLEKDEWLKAINQLFETGDLYEQQALYASLSLMPFSEEMLPRAIEGCRTNMTLVFDAIALNNPYAPKHFPELNWNQMVLKAVFMQRPLYRIQQLELRRNPALAEIASDFAHERWAAGRNVMPELWRLVSPFVNEKFMGDLEKVMSSEDLLEQKGGALALYHSDFAQAKELLNKYPELIQEIEKGAISWEEIGQEYQDTRV
ncbi:EboA domain-containing protein [Algoriphagus limi]|uniref:EboA domain-containing protein n=1 Tax=Algoriphagus limi TaxID=2975273 RepID=A0ABT2G7N9_9BACT|nr:EboA domain-containing protein [Algoriphagus limi]MCS5491284.1 EboA domain-containing protein [Algoriphagus limi]